MTTFRLLEAIGEVACTAPYEDGWDDPVDLPDRNFYMWVGEQVVEAIRKEGFQILPLYDVPPTNRESHWRAYTKEPDSSGRPYHPVLVGKAATKKEAQALIETDENGYVIEVVIG